MNRRFAVWFFAGSVLLAISCGYHVGGKADTMPKAIQTIAIPPFTTLTMRYTLTDELPRQIGREFTSRTRFAVVNNPAQADAVLNGTINSAIAVPTIYDPASGKATSVQVVINLTVKLLEQRTGKILYSRANWGIREDYELAVDPHQFFNESGPALDRLSQDVARDLVSAVVEDF
jgi:lipopolysaccharide assembly LptE-like protein